MTRFVQNSDDHIMARSDAILNTFDQAMAARDMLNLPPEAYLRLPFGALDGLVGGIAPGDVWFVAAFSGNGKTSLLMSLVLRLLQENRTVYYMGLESRPNVLRAQMACLRLGYDVGEVLSGAAKSWSMWDAIRAELMADIEQQKALREGYRFVVDGRPAIQADGLGEAMHTAAFNGADLVIIDHIDHLQLGDGTTHQQSLRVAHEILRLAHHYNLRLLIATQLNNETAKGDRLSIYQPPQPHHVYMGSHKRMIATGMLGLFRPTRGGLSKEEMGAVRSGAAEPSTILEPNTMGVVLMKHRYYGHREGTRAFLRVERGLIQNLSDIDQQALRNSGGLPR